MFNWRTAILRITLLSSSYGYFTNNFLFEQFVSSDAPAILLLLVPSKVLLEVVHGQTVVDLNGLLPSGDGRDEMPTLPN